MSRSHAASRLLPCLALAAVMACAAGSTPLASSPETAELPFDELAPHFRAGAGDRHAYTSAMLELALRLGAAKSAALGDDEEHAAQAAARLREQYVEVAHLVPSWRSWFPVRPLDELDAAIERGAPAHERERRVARIERGCTVCHVRFMFPVQARYRWGSFGDVDVETDTGAEVGLHEIMLDLATALGAIRGDVASSRMAAAESSYVRLKERFEVLELACSDCHREPREYFIDTRVKGRVLRLGGLVRRGITDVAQYDVLIEEVHEQSCFPCHQIHMPAAYLQEYWSRESPSESLGEPATPARD